ncbi:hypothetical protein JIG36_33245 [Actinoplanes sp. LDG1-06]|uniref:LysR substrate-binding domain-containing protein n=1 Tax=Paractinoplanes ovalisporus TaxID=2810368 RepID=A0ABS2AMF7_9ACTN|nr:LysR substrate-binding domain-containing protein [Actinoplanes ovalisporus]MBM2620389.1 hypothetical protein [Actinoplanes ovalisporus]
MAMVRAAVGAERNGLRGSLTFGTLHSISSVDVPALAGDFHRRHPGVRLRVEISARGAAGHAERLIELLPAYIRTDTPF